MEFWNYTLEIYYLEGYLVGELVLDSLVEDFTIVLVNMVELRK